MNRASIRPVVRTLLKIFRWGSTCYGTIFIGLKTNWDPVKAALLPRLLSDTWEFISVWGWSIAAGLAAATGPVIWASKQIQPEQSECILKAVLTIYRKKAMPIGALEKNFRVTLYKYRSFSGLQFMRWITFRSKYHPWSGWLCPYVRPGFCRTGSSARWHVSLQYPEKCEGVAGLVYVSEEPLVIENLPDRKNITGSEKKLLLYVKETKTPVSWLRKKIRNDGDLFPRSFYGSRVLVDGKIWGVLLFDSEHAQFPNPQGLNAETLEIMKILNAVLSSKL